MAFTVHFITIDVRTKALIDDLHGRQVAGAIEDAADAIFVPRMRMLVRKNGSVYTGRLLKSIGADVSRFSFDEGSVEVGAIGVPYGYEVESGSPPHTPDLARIRKWAATKLKSKNPNLTARRIVKRIKEKGIKPKPFARPVLRQYERPFVAVLTHNLKRRLKT